MPVGNPLQNFFAKPLAEFYYPFLVAGRAKMSSLARKGEQKFMPAFSTFYSCKTVMEDAAIKISVDDLFHIRSIRHRKRYNLAMEIKPPRHFPQTFGKRQIASGPGRPWPVKERL